MGKRTSIEPKVANPRDWWPTPKAAILPLIPHLDPMVPFIEPCAGDGALRDVLLEHGFMCSGAYDIEPRGHLIHEKDALDVRWLPDTVTITNPPYSRSLAVPLMRHWMQGETWLLIPSDWLMNLWFAEFAPHVWKIVPVGRVKWIEGSSTAGFENSAWVAFSRHKSNCLAGRMAKTALADSVCK